MPTFKVELSRTIEQVSSVEVEAASYDEARAQAEDLFAAVPYWETDSIVDTRILGVEQRNELEKAA